MIASRSKWRNLQCGEESTGIARSRIVFVLACVLFGSFGILLRMVQLQTREHGTWTKLALKQNSTAIEIQGARGNIFDTEGRPFAVSIEGAAVGIRPKQFDKKLLPKLADALDIPQAEMEGKLRSRFSWIARGIPRSQLDRLTNLNLRGVEIFPEFYRHYPQGAVGRMILGQVSQEGEGVAGVELKFNEKLKAGKERLSVGRDARGRFLDSSESEASFSFDLLIEPAVALEDTTHLRKEGGDINLSIDSTIQGILEEELKQGLEEAKAKRVIGVVMRAETGELVAMGQAIRQTSIQTSVEKFKQGRFLTTEELRNPLVQDIFEPGSTFKPLVAALALDAKKVSPQEMINCENGHYPIGAHVVHDAHPIRTVPFSEVLVRSSNVGIAKVGARLGKDGIKQGILKLGFGAETGIELPGEQLGMLQKGNWGAIQVATNSFGQGISVSAIQLVRAYAALANGGKLVRPTILKVTDPAKAREEATQVFSAKTAATVTDILVGVTEDEEGTGKKAALDGLKVSGKTGTAQKPKANGRGYEGDKVFASFIGYVDSSKLGVVEHLVMFIGVDEPGVYPRWGGTVAAPVFRRAMERVIAHRMVGS